MLVLQCKSHERMSKSHIAAHFGGSLPAYSTDEKQTTARKSLLPHGIIAVCWGKRCRISCLLVGQSRYLLFGARHFAQGSHLSVVRFLHFCDSPRRGLGCRCGALLREHQLAHARTQPRRQCPACQSASQVPLFQPPRADHMFDSDRQSWHPA